MGATAVKDQVLSVLKGTSLGEKLESEARAANKARQERAAARAKLDEGIAEREQLPKLAEKVEKAEAKYRSEMDRLSAKLAEARNAYSAAASSSARKYGRGESHLRRTASPLVHDNGAVFQALQAAIEHLRKRHFIGVEEDRFRRQAKYTPRSSAPEDNKLIDAAKDLVRDHDAAAEYVAAFAVAQDELRDLQLEVEVEAAEVREVVEGLPEACFCGRHEFTIEDAIQRALEPKKVEVR